MLTLENVYAAYGHSEALHGINIHIDEGEVVCVIGRNGAGKTSAMRCVVQDLIKVTKGTVTYRGETLQRLEPHMVIRKGIGYVPEDRRVFASLTVAENLRVPPSFHDKGTDPFWTLKRVFELFPQLDQFKSRLAGNLSGGQQQMLSIARSLLNNPHLLLLDEPHEGLAPVVAQEMVASILQLKSMGVSMLISEQHLHTVHECADRIYVIDRGMTVFEGTMAEFDADPEIARRYLMVVQ
ncbi:MAG: ABC transporter ATP-binding protein [Candidatus Lambdaproteobacteria bacterium]|nr:ABC transporter ATP-binding protein [Candidatus Lambdaproteobacteria bacterium]